MSEGDHQCCSLTGKKCVPCTEGVPPLKGTELQTLLTELQGDWSIVEEHHLVGR